MIHRCERRMQVQATLPGRHSGCSPSSSCVTQEAASGQSQCLLWAPGDIHRGKYLPETSDAPAAASGAWHGPASGRLATRMHQAPQLTLTTCVLPRSLPPQSLASQLPGNLNTTVGCGKTMNLFVQLFFIIRLGVTQFPAFKISKRKSYFFVF